MPEKYGCLRCKEELETFPIVRIDGNPVIVFSCVNIFCPRYGLVTIKGVPIQEEFIIPQPEWWQKIYR